MSIKLLHGDALTELQKLESESVDCCITSPPYWYLRNYNTDGQIGRELTFTEYIDKLITIFSQVKRVLKKTGSCWVVFGDSYDNNKSLHMIPSRFAIAMIDNVWILRNDIIWWKPNSMPSSVKNRFTVDYEHLFFFTKSQKYYFETQYESYEYNGKVLPYGKKGSGYYNHPNFHSQFFGGKNKHMGYGNLTYSGKLWNPTEKGRIKRSVWKISTKPYPDAHFAVYPQRLVETPIKAACPINGTVLDPFMGSGTTGLVALKNARNFIGVELNGDYIKLAEKRLEPYLKKRRN